MFNIEDELKKLPHKPGVYIMRNKDDKIIYVGKAISLKNRVTQYFRKTNKTQRIKNMVSLIDHFEYIVCDNEAEALILECNLIKENRPKFNVLLKDDKTYPYIRIGMKEEYPSIYITRRIQNDGAKYFGPYANPGAAREMLNFIKEKYNIAGDVKVDKFGKPYFEDTDIHFNISHSGCYVIAAVSDEDIGIDIQKIKSDKHRIAEKNFLPSECAYINEIEDEKINQQRFCEIWTIKEAYLKNIGIGLRKPLNSFEIDFSEDAPQIVGKKEYKFVQLKFDEKYIVTVCADQSDEIFDVEEVLVV